MASSDQVIAGIDIEISLRMKKIKQLEEEIKKLNEARAVLAQDQELEKLLDEEARIEAEATAFRT